MQSELTYTLILLVSTFTMGYSQLATYVDRAPLAKQCVEADLSTAVDCTSKLINDYFTLVVDTLACPDDTLRLYRGGFKVGPDGLVSELDSIRSWKAPVDCIEYFNTKVQGFLNAYEWIPATLNGQNVECEKQIGFQYPAFVDTLGLLESDTTVFSLVEEMPRFNGCEAMIGSSSDKEACALTQMTMHIFSSLKYPSLARENGVEGMVVVQFVVNTNGYLTDFNVVRSIGGGCDEAALASVKSMNEMGYPPFTPGVQRGKDVKVLYTMPIRFRLESTPLFPKRKKKKKNKD